MAMVFDGNLTEGCVRQTGAETAALLKSHSEIFRNVRLNIVSWEGDDELAQELSSLPLLLMGRALGGFRHAENKKRPELLAGYLYCLRTGIAGWKMRNCFRRICIRSYIGNW